MIPREGVLLVTLLSLAAPGHGQSHDHGPASVSGSAADEIASLALNLDNVVKVCSGITVRVAAGSSELGKAEKQAASDGLLTWLGSPPAELKAQTQAKYGPARFGRWFDPHASIWIIAYETTPTCRILVGGSAWTPSVRPALYAKMQDDAFWKMDGPEQPFQTDAVRAAFHADLPDGVPLLPMVTIVAPVKSVDGAMQLSIGVHIVKKEEK
jgi:hypothetical protein